jgi:antirestriction protein ArdC
MTFRQAIELGGAVRKGEKGSLVVYANTLTRTEADPLTGEETESAIPYLKGYSVFNVDQIDGLPRHFYAQPEPAMPPPELIAHADAFFAATKASLCHGGKNACYIARTDMIHMPCRDLFESAEAYYATLAHETTHWTGHPSRLDRSFGQKRFGDDGYAMEELVAEIGAAFLCASLGLSSAPREDHASYLACWLRVLKADTRAIFTAAAYAQRAADYLAAMQPGATPLPLVA